MKAWVLRYDAIRRAAGRRLSVLRSKRRLIAENVALGADNAELRERLIAAQQAKVLAQNQADALRKEKERLRERVASLKSEIQGLHNAAEQLQERFAAVQAENEALKS